MTTTVTATFANGVLTPDQPLQLGEQERVKVTIEPLTVPDPESWTPEKGRAAWEELKRMMKEKPLHFGGEKFTRDELYDRG